MQEKAVKKSWGEQYTVLRTQLRSIRQKAMDSFKKMKKSEGVSEDEVKDLGDQTQKLTDKFIKKVDEVIEVKTKEVMTV